VASALIEPCPRGMECCHGPNGKADDSLANISWGTKAENNGPDKVRGGTDSPRGERNGQARLSDQEVVELHRLHGSEQCPDGAVALVVDISADAPGPMMP
jgi:hypothetical protein